MDKGFGTIRNNTALKQFVEDSITVVCFGTIRNNTALKPGSAIKSVLDGFGTIRNNTALKPRRSFFSTRFRNRAIHLSMTSASK